MSKYKTFKIDISTILANKIIEYTPIFKNKDITIKKNIPPHLTANWTEKDFVRVIDNIISNAYYYSINGSTFELNVSGDKKLLIEMISTPTNVDNLDLNNIFTKGFRGVSSEVENSYGKGFGLYLCRLLLQSIGGSINVGIINENVKFTIML